MHHHAGFRPNCLRSFSFISAFPHLPQTEGTLCIIIIIEDALCIRFDFSLLPTEALRHDCASPLFRVLARFSCLAPARLSARLSGVWSSQSLVGTRSVLLAMSSRSLESVQFGARHETGKRHPETSERQPSHTDVGGDSQQEEEGGGGDVRVSSHSLVACRCSPVCHTQACQWQACMAKNNVSRQPSRPQHEGRTRSRHPSRRHWSRRSMRCRLAGDARRRRCVGGSRLAGATDSVTERSAHRSTPSDWQHQEAKCQAFSDAYRSCMKTLQQANTSEAAKK